MGHLTKWFFFNLLCGAIPYALTVALNQLQYPGTPLLHPSSEVLFIAVVASSSALGEVWEGEENRFLAAHASRAKWQLAILIAILVASLLDGAYAYATLSGPGKAHGLDCLAIAQWPPAGADDAWRSGVLARWGSACAAWAQTQALFFRCSLWLTAGCVVVSMGAMYANPHRRW
jgi:hypothetical protein